VPLARAFADDGHAVAFATSASFAGRVDAAGFGLLPAGISRDELEARVAPHRALLRTLPIPDRRVAAFAGRFGVIEAPAKLDALVRVLADWLPDLVVHDSADLAAPIAAAAAGVPSAHHAFGRSIPVACLAAAAAETASLWAGVGLEPEPLCGLYRGTYVDLCPPSFQGDGVPAGTPVEPIRPLFPPARDETPPAWLQTLPDRPLVYVTLGTVFNEPSRFATLLESLRDVECTAILTVGRDNDPADLGPLPANVLVEPYVAQWFVLPHSSLVVAHGGSGSILATLAAGLPTLLVPQGADQFENADRCVELGAGLRLLPDEVTAASVLSAVRTLLREASFRASARDVAAEIEAMPHPREVARRLAASR